MTTSEEIAVNALRRIQRLDLGRTEDGRHDFYSGVSRFVKAWLIAHAALKKIDQT